MYGLVVENRLAEALELLDSLVNRVVAPAVLEETRIELQHLFREVYVRGVVDGFAQGVEATAE